jgi:hypothetical protein
MTARHIDPDDIDYMLGMGGCAGGNCPAVLDAPGGKIFQGYELDQATMDAVREITAANGTAMGPGETALFVPDALVEQIRGMGS